MIRKFILLSLSPLFFFINKIFAQTPCGTDIEYQRLKAQYPAIADYEAQLEKDIKAGMEKLDFSKLARTTGADDTTIYDIPIVVHIIHDYGNEDINDTVIYNSVKDWTTVYLEENSDTVNVINPFKKYIGNPRCRFHLATIDPNGKPTKGVTRRQSYLTNKADDNAKMDDWPEDSYVNIWFVNSFGGDLTGAAAYAHYPSVSAIMPYYDGVVSLYSYIDYSKTIPHEIGHVFNLFHVFGNTNSPGISCGDDSVDDTPPTLGHTPEGCIPAALYDTTCASNYFKIYKRKGLPDSLVDYPDTVNSQNIMDYTYCSIMFTKGQVERMRATLADSIAGRNNLYSAANLAKTGALLPMPDLLPVADFTVLKGVGLFTTDKRSVFMCVNSAPFTFKNASWNDTITGVKWIFSNGASTPTSTNPGTLSNTFSQPGWVTVTLIATGNNTGSDTVVRQAVYVADTSVLQPAGYLQTFNNIADTAKWPIFNYYNNQFKWEWDNTTGYDDKSCIRYRSFDDRISPENKSGQESGDYDDIYTQGFNLSAYTSGDLNLNFYTSGSYRYRQDSIYKYPVFAQQKDSLPTDSLEVFISTSCGESWNRIALIKDSDLLNNPRQNVEFTPSSTSQWVARTINIPTTERSNKAFFRFRYWPANNGNDFYLDKFAITPFATEVNEVAADRNAIKIFPNPAHGAFNIAFTTSDDGKTIYSIKDITGKLIYQATKIYVPNSVVQEKINNDIFPASGMYLVTVTIANNSITQKLIVEK